MPDPDLIATLEALAVREKRETASIAARLFPDAGVRCENIAGGVAVYGGTAIGVASMTGIGLSGPLSAEEHEQVRAFLKSCEAGRVEASVVPGRTDPGFAVTLDACGMRLLESEQVMVMELSEHDGLRTAEPHDARAAAPDARGGRVVAERVPDADRQDWAVLVATAFSDGIPPVPADLRFARCLTHRSGTELFRAHFDGEVCAAAELWMGEGVAWLAADATLPAYRRKGAQVVLQRARIEHAAREGCRLAVTEAVPGTSSASNAQRLGFDVAYTRLILGRESA